MNKIQKIREIMAKKKNIWELKYLAENLQMQIDA